MHPAGGCSLLCRRARLKPAPPPMRRGASGRCICRRQAAAASRTPGPRGGSGVSPAPAWCSAPTALRQAAEDLARRPRQGTDPASRRQSFTGPWVQLKRAARGGFARAGESLIGVSRPADAEQEPIASFIGQPRSVISSNYHQLPARWIGPEPTGCSGPSAWTDVDAGSASPRRGAAFFGRRSAAAVAVGDASPGTPPNLDFTSGTSRGGFGSACRTAGTSRPAAMPPSLRCARGPIDRV